jgi:hypothetical protein
MRANLYWMRAVEAYLSQHRSAVELWVRRIFTAEPDIWREP